MSCLTRWLLLAVGGLYLLLLRVNSQKVLQMPLKKRTINGTTVLGKRDPFAIALQNYLPSAEYYVTALVGTPKQDIEFVLDTGSSDVWMFGPESCNERTSPCEGGEFLIQASRTASYQPGGRGAFNIKYVTEGSGASGDYFVDTLEVGKETVTSMVMAVATAAAYVPSAVMGIGLSINEAGVSQGLGRYPNFPDLLVKQGIIKHKAYSLYLDDIGSPHGMMIFGGFDQEKFSGDLTLLPIQMDEFSGGRRGSFIVSLTSLGRRDDKGEFTILEDGGLLYPATLDTGTTLTYLPTKLYEEMARYFQIEGGGPDSTGHIDCDFGKKNPGQLVYGFGGRNGPLITVEFDELIFPFYSPSGEAVSQEGTSKCAFGILDAGDNPIIFGQSFLRSAYVLYDLENLQIGLAQTVFDSTSSDVVEYNGPPAPRVKEIQGPQVTATLPIPTMIGSIFPDSGSGEGSGRLSVVRTDFTIATVAYPSETPSSIFPSTIPIGPTGRIPFSSGNDQGHSDTGNAGSSSGGNNNSNSDNDNDSDGNGNGNGNDDDNSNNFNDDDSAGNGGSNAAASVLPLHMISWSACFAIFVFCIALL